MRGNLRSYQLKKTLQIKHVYGGVWVPALRSTLPLKLLCSLKHNDMISC